MTGPVVTGDDGSALFWRCCAEPATASAPVATFAATPGSGSGLKRWRDFRSSSVPPPPSLPPAGSVSTVVPWCRPVSPV